MRLIDADALRKMMFSYYAVVNENTNKRNYHGETLMAYEVAYLIDDCIDNAPTVDAEPVRHGKWINEDFPQNAANQNNVSICSLCGEMSHKAEHGYSILSKYCPNCGAKMDG